LFFPPPRCPETSVHQSLSDAAPRYRSTKTADNDVIFSLEDVMLTLDIRRLSTRIHFIVSLNTALFRR